MTNDRRKGPRERRLPSLEKGTFLGNSVFVNPDNGGRRRDLKTREWFDSINSWPTTRDLGPHDSVVPNNAYESWQNGFVEGMRIAIRWKESK